MAQNPPTLIDQELIEEFQTVMSKYAMLPGNPPLKILTVGRGGHGKSTLINNLLNLEGEAAATAFKSGKPVTKAVDSYEKEVNSVTVHIYDTPGLQDDTIDEQKVIKEIENLTKGYVHILFYVSSLNDRINSADERIIKAITSEFKVQVWEHAVLVLTHADNHCRVEAEYIRYTDEFAETFQKYIRKHRSCANIRVKCIREKTEGAQAPDDSYEIAAIPTGLNNDGEPKGWYHNLLIEAVNKCCNEATPLLMIATNIFPVGGNIKARNTATIAGNAMSFAGAGATLGSVAGAVAGAVGGTALALPTAGLSIPLGLLVGGGVGAGIGAAAGAATGTGVGVITVASWFLWPIIKRKRLLEQLKRSQ